MATFVALLTFRDRTETSVRETCQRAEAFKWKAHSIGLTIREMFWTLGPYDGLLVFEAPDEETATAGMLAVGALGNVRTQTLRAFGDKEMEAILGKAFRG